MSTSSKAAIWVGLPREAITNQDLIEDESLEVCPPYMDGNGASYAIAGFELLMARYPTELALDDTKLIKLKERFQQLTGQTAKVWLSLHVC